MVCTSKNILAPFVSLATSTRKHADPVPKSAIEMITNVKMQSTALKLTSSSIEVRKVGVRN